MFIDFHIRNEAAKQLREQVGFGIPVDPPGWSAGDRLKLREVLDELNWADLATAVHAAAARLAERAEDPEGRSDDTKAPSKITEVG